MIKLRNSFVILIAFSLTACNAFKQKVNQGPGTGEFKDHTFEILIMLGGAFALGLWLGWILWNKYKQMVDGLRMENESLTTSVGTLRGEVESLKSKLAASETEKNDLNTRVGALSWENSDYKSKLINLEADLVNQMERNTALDTQLGLALASTPESANVPMEVSSTPIDLHIENLAAPVEIDVAEEPEMTAEIIDLQDEESIDMLSLDGNNNDSEEIYEGEFIAESDLASLDIHHNSEIGLDLDPELTALDNAPIVELQVDPINEPIDILGEPESNDEVESDAMETTENEPVIASFETTESEAVITSLVADDLVEQVAETADTDVDAEINEEIVFESPNTETIEETLSLPIVEEPIMTFADISAPLVAPAAVSEMRDDLKVVEGIGPKIEELLFKNGIHTFTQLAATPVNRIKEILIGAGPSYAMHDPGTWPAQSLLAANNEWDNLKAYQSFLNAGKRPS